MANILDKFQSTTVGSSGRIMDYLSRISENGDFQKMFNLDAILTSWRNILTTPKGSCDHDPDYGSNLYLLLFEPADSSTQQAIKSEIVNALTTYDDRASIEDIQVAFLKNKKGFSVSIFVDYLGETTDLNLTLNESMFQNL